MSDGSRVLCLSTDESFVARVSASLEASYPELTVLTATDVEPGIDAIETGDVDCVVSDCATAASAPALFRAIRDRRPDPSLLLLARYGDGEDAAIAEVVEFVDDVGTSGANDALASWVANSVLDGRPVGAKQVGAGSGAVVADVKRRLADARSPSDVESAVAERLVAGDRFAFAWIGEFDRGEGQIVPWATAARDGEWPRAKPVAGREGADNVVATTVRSRTRTVVDLVGGAPPDTPWGDAASERGCTAVAFQPLVSGGDLVGVMGAYDDSPGGFDDADLDALDEIGDATAYALEGMAIRGRIDQQERTLRRYERLVETVDDGMYALDDEGHFMTVNDALCAMAGYSREGILGEHVALVFGEDGATRWERAVEELQAADGRGARSLELDLECKGGTTVPCENRVALLEGGGTVGVLRDVTERRERERELRRQNERLDAFASIVSHDLRNPLSVAQGYLELVEEGDTDAVEDVQASLDRIEQIVDDVLTLARDGGDVTDPERVDLETVAREAWGLVRTGEATLEVPESVTLSADRSRLQRVLENLYRNSIQHADETVTVRVGSLADAPGFYVEDDGPGMEPEVRDRVFDSGFTTAADGHGIGLWVVGEVADAHGWSARATVGSEGGARFEFAGVELR